eukprot:3029356-Rhodomonas_salina.3
MRGSLTWEEILELLVLRGAADDIEREVGRAARSSRSYLGILEVDHSAVVSEEVDLLNPRDVVHAKALQRVLQPLVICHRSQHVSHHEKAGGRREEGGRKEADVETILSSRGRDLCGLVREESAIGCAVRAADRLLLSCGRPFSSSEPSPCRRFLPRPSTC